MASRRVVQYLLGESLKGDRVEPLNPALVAELCKAWLALDAAPVVVADSYPLLGPLVKLPFDTSRGDIFRIVPATPASGGTRDG